jgi:glycerophosphoryl diester phosphodiesterase
LVRLVLENNYGGLLGNYFFIKDDVIHELQSKGKQLGFGFISSKNSLYREVNRGIYWIYTNKPERLLRMIKNF